MKQKSELSSNGSDLITAPLTSSEYSNELNVPEERTFFQRAFGPIGEGAMRGSIFALLASAMGTGVFNLPLRISQIGVVPYALMITAGAFFSYLGMYMMSRLIVRFNVLSYSQMTQRALGKPLKRVAEFCLIIYPWGATICFQVIFSKFVMQLLDDTFDLGFFDNRQDEIYSSKGDWVRIGVQIGCILLNLIFILKKQIGILQKVAVIGVLSVIINSIVVFITAFTGFTVTLDNDVELKYHGLFGMNWSQVRLFNTESAGDSIPTYLECMATFIFCFVNHQLLFPLNQDLKNPTKRRLDKIFNRVHITELVVYILVGLSGYLLLSEHEAQREINSLVIASIPTVVVSIGKLLLVAALFIAIPLNLFPSRQVLFECLALEKNNKNHIIVSLFLAFAGCTIGILFQSVNSYFGLLGGTAGVAMSGVIPAICYMRVKGLRTKNQVMIVVYVGIIAVLSAAGAIISVLNA